MRPIHLLLPALTLLVTGCLTQISRPDVLLVGSVDEIPRIQQTLGDRLEKLAIGMSLASFQSVFPDAYVGGQSGETTAYELTKKTKYALKGDWNPYHASVQDLAIKTETQILWFYFYDGRLAKWGKPQDWPARPDQIIEVRSR